jgi:hypothetical protein
LPAARPVRMWTSGRAVAAAPIATALRRDIPLEYELTFLPPVLLSRRLVPGHSERSPCWAVDGA